MSSQLFKNNAASNLSGSLTQGGTTLVLATGTGDRFPSPTDGDYFLLTVFEKDETGIEEYVEIVKVTARIADTLTIERDYETMTGNSGGYAYPSAANRTVYLELRWTAAAADNCVQRLANLGDLDDAAEARDNIGISAENTPFTPTTGLSATDVQAAIEELAAETQSLDPTLSALAGVATAADKVPYFTNTDTAAVADLTAYGRSLIGGANAAAVRTTLGLGSAAVEPSSTFALSATTLTAGTGLSGGGSLAANRTLSIANTTVTAASYGSATQVGTFTVNAQGQLTAASNVTITPAFSSVTGKPTTLSGYGITDAQNTSEKNQANGYAGLDGSGLIPSTLLPSYVDDVLEYAALANFPATGETGKIYVALDTNKTYRWSGSAYVYITSGAVDSVAGKTGVVTLVKGDVGLGNVENTSLSTWAGTTNITTLGTVATGTWNATTISVAKGGTGATDAATARTNLGVAIGSNVQAWDADLDAIASLAGTSGFLKKTAANTWSLDTNTYLTGITSGQVTTALGYTPYNSTNPNGYTTNTGTVTSVGMTVPTGLSVSGTPITGSGTLAISLASGYSIPTTASQANWDTAYTDRNKWDGGATGLVAATGRTSLGLGTAATMAGPAGTLVGTTDTQTLSAKTITGLKETKVAMAANDVDLSAGNWFTKTISTATTLTVSNVPATGTAVSFILDLTNGGSATITWWSGMKWAGGTAPTLTASGRDALGFFTHDGGTTWTGLVLGKDVK